MRYHHRYPASTYEEELCNEFKTLGEEVCQKVLTVSVTELLAA
jgi:hypothetical protein